MIIKVRGVGLALGGGACGIVLGLWVSVLCFGFEMVKHEVQKTSSSTRFCERQ